MLHPTRRIKEAHMWWGIGGGLMIIWIVLLITCGIVTLRNGHWVLFVIGIFLPLLWIIGAVIPPKAAPGVA
jgi:hypothetical protein